MKKQAISMLLAISMIASLVCVPGFAEDAAGSDNHGHVISDVQCEGQVVETPDGYVGGSEGETGPEDPITSPVNSGDDIYNDIPEEQIMTEDYVSCIHGKTMGETCELCGELAHSSKNIPLIGYDQEFFDQVNPDEDEGWLLYTIRLVCPHGTADGLYCEKCGHVVDSDPADLPMCTILDSCLHGHVKGEKCEACQELKEEQGDYELAEGEAWDDPLIYTTDLMAFDSNVADMNGSGMLHCSWCGTALGDGINVACHWDSSKGQYHWCTISRVEASGTCESHYVTWVYKCGVRISTNNSPYPCHHTGNCTWNTYKNWHTDILSTASCLTEGRTQKYYTNICTHCGAESSPRELKTDVFSKLDHIITNCTYVDSNTHKTECAGNNTDPHTFVENHIWEKEGENYICSGCGAVKTTVHIDAYSITGEPIKSNLITDFVIVGNDGPEFLSIQDYLPRAIEAGKAYNIYPAANQNDSQPVQLGGIHLSYYGMVDVAAPSLSATIKDDTISITVYDDFSGVKELKYLGLKDEIDSPYQHVGETNKKEIEYDASELPKGIYQIIAVDYAGNSCSINLATDDNIPITDQFSMYVPSNISFKVDVDGNVTVTPNDPKIYNGSETRPICIKEIVISQVGGWQLVDYNSDFSAYPKGSSYIGLAINGCPASTDGTVKTVEDDWVISENGTFDLNFDIKVPKQTREQNLPDVLRVGFVGDWSDEIASQKHLITIVPTDKATLSPDVLAVYTDAFGEITSLPQVIEKSEDFTFEKWVNVETNEEVKVGQVLYGDISITPQMKSHIKAKLHIGNVSSIVSRFSEITTVEFGTVNSPVNDSALYECGTGNGTAENIVAQKVGNTLYVFGYNVEDNKVVFPESCYYLMGKCGLTGMSSLVFGEYVDTSDVTDMSRMFYFCKSIKALDLRNFDTSNVTDMGYMIYGCDNLISVDVSSFNTSKVTNMGDMFQYSNSIQSLDLTNFDTSNVTSMGQMFMRCESLKTLDVSTWDTGKVTNMYKMFWHCPKLTSVNWGRFAVCAGCTDSDMFTNCPANRP